MASANIDHLPCELLHLIANYGIDIYRPLLGLSYFARSLTPSDRADYMIAFGYTVRITARNIKWYYKGMLHNKFWPARINIDGTRKWYLYNALHREGGPAVLRPNGTAEWYIGGLRQRKNGPAFEDGRGNKIWYHKGMPHREDGPAVKYAYGRAEWWINGIYCARGPT